jgi:hypothetical protein
MKTIHMTDDLVFSAFGPYTHYLMTDQIGRICRYTLQKGQEIDDLHSPYQPRYFVVVSGDALLKSLTQKTEERCGPGTLITFDPKEESAIIALSDEVVIIGITHWMTGG